MTRTVVRSAALDDLEALAVHHAECFGLDLDRARRDLREELARPWARVLVIAEHERVVGHAIFWFVADEANLLHVGVTPTQRRRGLGAALLEHGFALAREASATTCILEVRIGNTAAIELYRRLGFREVTTRARYYDDGEDALVMDLRLADP